MEYLIAGTVYIVSVLLARYIVIAITKREYERDHVAFVVCLTPFLNSVFVVIAAVIIFVGSLEPLAKKAARWFFKNKP